MPDADLLAEHEGLKRRLEEAEETLHAIRTGAVDAFVVTNAGGQRVYTLEGADRPYRLLVEQMQQGAATLLSDGTIAYCNRSLAALLDMPHARVVGKALRDFVIGSERVTYAALLEQGRTGSGRGETRLNRADGVEIPVFLTINALPADCGAAIAVLVTDLTAQRLHEQLSAAHRALRDSEQRLRFVMDSMPLKLFTAGQDGAVDYLSPSWLQFTGLAIEQIRGWGWTQFIHPDDLTENLRVWHAALASGRAFEFEHRFRRHDGQYRWHLSRALPMHDAHGAITLWIGANADVHEQREASDRLRLLAAQLSEADRRKDEFLAMLAHELRNPLAPIHNAVQLLRMTPGLPADILAASSMMDRQLQQIIRLVDDLLDVSRVSRGKIELCRERIALTAVVEHAVEAARTLVDCAGHTLEVDLPSDPIHILGDHTRLAQVIGNLLNNACKFTRRGGRIRLSLQRTMDQRAWLRVADNGIGIPADQMPRIFEMFAQLDNSLERTHSGLGIGLTLVKRLVEMHGGTVAVHSDGVGAGSAFDIHLPLGAAAVAARPEPPVSAMARAPAVRVLVVDDNRDSALSLAMLLDLAGHQTRQAFDGLEAVAAAAEFSPDLVLLDIGLPKLNGYEAARRIRQTAAGKRLTLVAVTGWGQDDDRRRSQDAGFDTHMVKPVDHATLMRLIADLPRVAPQPALRGGVS